MRKDSCLFIKGWYITRVSGHSAVGSALALGARSREFESRCPDHFFAQMGKKKWSRQASLHAPQVRFMAQRAASYGEAVLHKSLTMKHCSAKTHNMKQLHYIPLWSTSLTLRMMRKMKNASFSVCSITLHYIINGEAVLHKSLTMKHCSAKAPQYEAAPLHSAMKHSAFAPYDEKNEKCEFFCL